MLSTYLYSVDLWIVDRCHACVRVCVCVVMLVCLFLTVWTSRPNTTAEVRYARDPGPTTQWQL